MTLEDLKEDSIKRLMLSYALLTRAAELHEKKNEEVPPLVFWQRAAVTNMIYILQKYPLEEFVPMLRHTVEIHYAGDEATKAAVEWYQHELTTWESATIS